MLGRVQECRAAAVASGAAGRRVRRRQAAQPSCCLPLTHPPTHPPSCPACCLQGPKDTVYEGGLFSLAVDIPARCGRHTGQQLCLPAWGGLQLPASLNP
jgi:hypothetical protein